jgi:dTDP-4-dehydrorhamnose reductase
MKKILIFGNDQIANFYKRSLPTKCYDVNIAQADITNVNEIEKSINDFKPEIVINTVAKTNLE